MISNPKKLAQNIWENYDDSSRAVAKLMARENITVQVIDGLKTADFDPVTRLLRLPNWPGLTKDQLDLLIGHEVGHALYTDTSYLKTIMNANGKGKMSPGLMSYFNVIEDTRIERKMRSAFPGLRKSFYDGYKQFTENGPILKITSSGKFIHPVSKDEIDVRTMDLIDRINLHYKIGVFLKIPFTASELAILRRVDAVNTMSDALKLAEELYKQQQEENSDEAEGQDPNASTEEDKSSSSQGSPSSSGRQNSKVQRTKDWDKEDGSDDASDSDDQKSEKSEKSNSKSKSKSEGSGDKESSEKSEKSNSKSKSKSEGSGDDADDSEGDSDGDADGESDESGSSKSKSASGDDDGDDDGDASDNSDPNAPKREGSNSNAPDQHWHGASSGTEETSPYAKSKKKGSSDPTSLTDESSSASLASSINDATNPSEAVKHLLLRPLPESVVKERSTPASEWAAETIKALNEIQSGVLGGRRSGSMTPEMMSEITSSLKVSEERWNTQYMPTAKYMASEFMRRKTAKNLQRAKIGKTGKINPNRLHSFKFSDDIFLRSLTIPNGQSHGIVMVIDASGSMGSVFPRVLDQVLLFANFTKRANIPFECYLFTSAGDTRASYRSQTDLYPDLGPMTLTLPGSGRLVGIINTTDRSFKDQLRAVHALRSAHDRFSSIGASYEQTNAAYYLMNAIPYSGLGSTPLYAGLMIAERHLERMKRTMKLDKVMQIVITDGEDTENLYYKTSGADRYGTVADRFSALHSAAVVRDTVTKKNHVLVDDVSDPYTRALRMPTSGLMSLLLTSAKDRHDARNIMLFLHSGSKSSGSSLISQLRYLTRPLSVKHTDASGQFRNTYEQDYASAGMTVAAINESLSAKEQYVMPTHLGIADLTMAVLTKGLVLQEDNFAQTKTDGMSAKRITQKFVAALEAAKSNRVFVNTVMPFIS